MKRRISFVFGCSALLALAGCHARRVPPPARTGGPETAAVLPARPARNLRAAAALDRAVALLRRGKAGAAVSEFHRCLVLEPARQECLDGKGRAHAALREWEDAVQAWAELSRLRPEDRKLVQRLAAARRSWKAYLERRARAATHPAIGAVSSPAGALPELRLIARFQRYNPKPVDAADVYDKDIDSPKSVRISSDGSKAYVNSLEGARTVIYDARTLTKLGTIPHVFGPARAGLFPGAAPWLGGAFSEDLPPEGPNVFTGKPVESEFSHGGRFLWVPYYRRNFDLDGTQPSAAAIIDTRTGAIVRVLPTGPIAKNAAASPDGRYMAVAHWGNNSVGLIDISSADPMAFSSAAVIALGPASPPPGAEAVNRDLECGLCVRGLAWTADSGTLFAGCMGGPGGIGVISVSSPGSPGLLGRVDLGGKPRDLLVSPDGRWLYVTASKTGSVLRAETAAVINAASAKGPARGIAVTAAKVGGLPRSMKLSPDGKWLYVALNGASEVAVVDTAGMTVASRMAADSFPVGLDISPDGGSLWVTSQGIDGAGGNSVEVYSVAVPSAGPPQASPAAGGLQRVTPPVP